MAVPTRPPTRPPMRPRMVEHTARSSAQPDDARRPQHAKLTLVIVSQRSFATRSSAPRSLCLLATTTLLALAACSKPKPPTIVPKSAQVVSIDRDGTTIQLQVELTNPNAFPLTAQRVKARVQLEGPMDLGEVNVPQALSLPANAPTLATIPITIRWEGAAAFASVAAKGRDVPFVVDGTVTVGGEKLNVDLPYRQTGVITQAQLRDAAIRSIEKLIPNLR